MFRCKTEGEMSSTLESCQYSERHKTTVQTNVVGDNLVLSDTGCFVNCSKTTFLYGPQWRTCITHTCHSVRDKRYSQSERYYDCSKKKHTKCESMSAHFHTSCTATRHLSTKVDVELHGWTSSQVCPWHGINVSCTSFGSLASCVAFATPVMRLRCVSTSRSSTHVTCHAVPKWTCLSKNCTAISSRTTDTRVSMSSSMSSVLSAIARAFVRGKIVLPTHVRIHATRSYDCFIDVSVTFSCFCVVGGARGPICNAVLPAACVAAVSTTRPSSRFE